jgi:hypothetical protein
MSNANQDFLRNEMRLLSDELFRTKLPGRTGRGVTADFEFDASGTYKVGEPVSYSGGANINVDAGEPAGLYTFIFYVFAYTQAVHIVYKRAGTYPVVSDGHTPSGYSPIILGKISSLPAGDYTASCVVTVIRPGSNSEEELGRKDSNFKVI